MPRARRFRKPCAVWYTGGAVPLRNALNRQKLTIAYRNAADQAAAEGNAQLASALYDEYVRQQELALQQQAAAQEQANWEAKFQYQRQQDSFANAASMAELLAGFGDFSGL